MNDHKIKIKSNRQYCNSKYINKRVNKGKNKELNDKYSFNIKNEDTSSKIKYIYHENEEKKYTNDCSDLF